ncbi:MAG: ATP-binding protein [Bacteroidetes bacterium]|uniref:ATP-binding protein n=1 Tax=Candidatus Merdivivens pullistercoris TaxID=2840873 RepID=A0A9D9NA45_9BACT|nr:ATP-binding protein [Candidatus Merdivivens pullistercoris]
MKYPIGVQSFEQIREDGYVYVDKTRLVYDLATNGKIYFLSRPRRFGKSLLISTLKNYFSGKKELFKGLAIDELEKEWIKYPVFHMDFNAGNFTNPGELEKKITAYLSGWEAEYGREDIDMTFGDRFVRILEKAHRQTGQRCVVLIDEYDKPMLDVLDTDYTINIDGQLRPIEDWNRDVLKGFYSAFKAADADLHFVLLTGVTKFSQVSIFSGFNQPKDISMDKRYDALCGITQQELESYFAAPISEMAKVYGTSQEEMLANLKRRYDGYHFSKAMTDIYNPFSLLNAFDSLDIQSYWFSSGTPSYLIRLLSHSGETIEDYTKTAYRQEAFIDYKADKEMPLPMIYQSGYLTIKSYLPEEEAFMLDFPNEEVRSGFVSLLASDYLKIDRNNIYNITFRFRKALENGDTDSVRNEMEAFLSDIPYTIRSGNKDTKAMERDFQYTFYLFFRMAGGWKVYTEKASSYGRADCIIETTKYIYIFEFKLDGTAKSALQQINRMGYCKPYMADGRKIICIGASFSSTTGTIEDWLTA